MKIFPPLYFYLVVIGFAVGVFLSQAIIEFNDAPEARQEEYRAKWVCPDPSQFAVVVEDVNTYFKHHICLDRNTIVEATEVIERSFSSGAPQ